MLKYYSINSKTILNVIRNEGLKYKNKQNYACRCKSLHYLNSNYTKSILAMVVTPVPVSTTWLKYAV